MKPLEQHLQEKGFGSEIDQRIAMIIKAAHEFYNAPQPEEKRLPMSWEDLESVNGYYTNAISEICVYSWDTVNNKSRNTFPTREEAEASIALAQLLQLRNSYSGKHDKEFGENESWALEVNGCNSFVFCFETKATRDLFKSTFADLIKQASPLL